MILGSIYLIHFDRRIGGEGRKGAMHYLGFTPQDPRERLEDHRLGRKRAARILTYCNSIGVRYDIVRVWKNVTRQEERRMKNAGHFNRLCPVCTNGGIQMTDTTDNYRVAENAREISLRQLNVFLVGRGWSEIPMDSFQVWLARGDRVLVFENHALNSADCGELLIMPFESDRPLPYSAPDSKYGLGWKYLTVAYVEPDNFVEGGRRVVREVLHDGSRVSFLINDQGPSESSHFEGIVRGLPIDPNGPEAGDGRRITLDSGSDFFLSADDPTFTLTAIIAEQVGGDIADGKMPARRRPQTGDPS